MDQRTHTTARRHAVPSRPGGGRVGQDIAEALRPLSTHTRRLTEHRHTREGLGTIIKLEYRNRFVRRFFFLLFFFCYFFFFSSFFFFFCFSFFWVRQHILVETKGNAFFFFSISKIFLSLELMKFSGASSGMRPHRMSNKKKKKKKT